MGPETSSREEMESLILEDDQSTYRSAMASSSIPEDGHPLSAVPVDGGDPLRSHPPQLNQSLRSSSSFLDPPSYADVIFSPFEGHNGQFSGHLSLDGESSSRSEHSPETGYARIAVSDPLKEQEAANSLVPGSNTYVTYLITSKTLDPDLGGPCEVSVRRRFRDFVTLSDRLAESYRGFFIPPRPDKNVMESQLMQKQEFVEQRRSALEKYLRRLAGHPVVGKSDELRVFLQVQGKLPLPATTDVASRMLDGAVRLPKQLFGEPSTGHLAPQDVVQPARGGRDLLRIFKELRQSVANDWGGTKPLAVEEDKEFLESKEKIQDLEQHLSSASQQVLRLLKFGLFLLNFSSTLCLLT